MSPAARVSGYLRDGPMQRRLLAVMSDGHARGKHGAQLGNPTPDAYRARVSAHLAKAPVGFAVTGAGGRPRYLIADAATNQVAWITPHKEHRSTFFAPRQGIDGYMRYLRTSRPSERWQPLDLNRARAATHAAGRASSPRIASTVRASAQRGGPVR